MLGTFILWFGWYGFNSGNAFVREWSPEAGDHAALAATNTTLAAGTAGIVALLSNLWWLERATGEAYFDLQYTMNGSLTGLVAIAAGCGVVEPWAAVVTGFFAGLVYMLGSRLLVYIRIDDAVNAIPVHLLGGIWGVLSVGLFASPTRLESVYHRSDHPGLLYSWHNRDSDGTLIGIQIVGLLFIIGWVMVIMVPFFIWLDWKGWFRSDPLEEIVGLDTSFHGVITGSHDESINPEHIEAFKKRRQAAKGANMRWRQAASDLSSTRNEEYEKDESSKSTRKVMIKDERMNGIETKPDPNKLQGQSNRNTEE
jgi:Amt family ammonium transporter